MNRNALIEDYLGFADALVSMMMRERGYIKERRDDLIGAGREGLIDAVNKYDASRGVPFKTYAWRRIRGAVEDHVRADMGGRGKLKRKARDEAVTLYLDDPDTNWKDSIYLSTNGQEQRTCDKDLVTKVLRRLSTREAIVLVFYHVGGYTMRETGEILGITESRVSQVNKQAIQRARRLVSASVGGLC